jgi:internalin A
MKKGWIAWYLLGVIPGLAGFGPSVGAGAAADKKEVPRPLPPEVVKVWGDAGASPGWMKDLPPKPSGGYAFWEPFREKTEAGTVPAFRFHPNKTGALAKLPDPGVAFGLDTHCCSMNDAKLKELAGLKSLQSLNLGGALLLTDAGLKELAPLTNLHGLYLFYAHVTDAGMKELAVLKKLQALDLSNTRVTDVGLKDVAGLKSLRALNLGGTKVTDSGIKALAGLCSLEWLSLSETEVTAAGVAALQMDLPNCKIVTRE